MLLIVTAAAVLYFGIFRIREIRVIGNKDISAADVIRFSGIRKGDSIFRLSESDTERRLTNAATSAAAEQGNFNYYRLQFRYLEKELPGTVTIAVREREACCWLTWCGIMYVMDKNGMVLYETEDAGMRDRVRLVEVKGLDIRSGAQAGQTMVLSSASQELLFKDLPGDEGAGMHGKDPGSGPEQPVFHPADNARSRLYGRPGRQHVLPCETQEHADGHGQAGRNGKNQRIHQRFQSGEPVLFPVLPAITGKM